MIFGKLKMYAVALGGLFFLILGAFFKGRSSQIKKHEREQLIRYQQTRQRMDGAEITRTANDARKWLENRK